MFVRTVGKLMKVGDKARNCGKNFVILPWGKIKQGLALVLKQLGLLNVKIIKNLEEQEISDK